MNFWRLVFCAMLLFAFLPFPVFASLEYPPGPAGKGPEVSVGETAPLIEVQDGRLTVKLQDVPWGVVLKELERRTGSTFYVQGPLEGKVTEGFKALSVEEGLQRLFDNADFIFFYTKAKGDKRSGGRLVQVWILPRRGGNVAETPQALYRPSQPVEDSLGLLINNALTAQGWEERDNALEALAEYKDPRVREVLLQAMQDSDENVRESAIDALADLKDEAAFDPLSRALKEDPSEDVRESAVDALGEIDSPGAVEAVIGALEDESADVRESAVDALGRVGGQEAIEALERALQDEDESVGEAAREALRRLTGKGSSD